VSPSVDDLPILLEGARAASDRLIADVLRLDDDAMRAPSILPGWTRAHVVTHLARNAESHATMLLAAAEWHRVEQYPGGADAKMAAIEAGSSRSVRDLVVDLQAQSARLAEVWAEAPDHVWTTTYRTLIGERQGWSLVWGRWRECDIHHVDLALGYAPRDWPDDFVDLMMPEVVASLDRRLPSSTSITLDSGDGPGLAGGLGPRELVARGRRAELLAWMLGRPGDVDFYDSFHQATKAPVLAPWG
jgi:maleylpyruvate isomerase